MQFIDPLLFSSLLLLTIPTTGVVSWVIGIEGIPDWYTIIGGSVIITGIGLITYSEQKRSQAENNKLEINNVDSTIDESSVNYENNGVEMSNQNKKINDNKTSIDDIEDNQQDEETAITSISKSFNSLTSPISITGLLNKSSLQQQYTQIQQEDVEDN